LYDTGTACCTTPVQPAVRHPYSPLHDTRERKRADPRSLSIARATRWLEKPRTRAANAGISF
ncbi:MAG: hypothetical protein LBP56_06340, partial [Odoribacteraceae bacterium]|nr:hypothetical protein [Odoribacteraceae bacterium]